tara:strand:+ start:32499 stop:33227 length:729 start_codon:yes stop_codon:yes gene_type:complete
MTKEYDEITASHYSAYRPSLHSEILKAFFKSNKEFELGLDIGCGTGQSSIALASYCKKVVGIDPSIKMLEKSIHHPKVNYQLISTNTLNFDSDTFHIITFAGSLYYAKSQSMLDEIVRVAKKNSRIIIYDFEIFLEEIFQKLGLQSDIIQTTDYDHQTNFSELEEQSIKLENEIQRSVTLDIQIADLAHLVLSSKDNYAIFASLLSTYNLYSETKKKLQSVFKNEMTTLKAMTFLTSYQVFK